MGSVGANRTSNGNAAILSRASDEELRMLQAVNSDNPNVLADIAAEVGRRSTESFRRVDRETVSNWVNTQNAGNFLDDAPASITVGGVTFNWLDGVSINGGDRYINTYQATEQAANGEYPIIETVVNRRRVRGGAYRWSFDKSTFGTGLR